MEGLKPCPCCKSTDVDMDTQTDAHNIQWPVVYCVGCGMRGPEMTSAPKAAYAWNMLPRYSEGYVGEILALVDSALSGSVEATETLAHRIKKFKEAQDEGN